MVSSKETPVDDVLITSRKNWPKEIPVDDVRRHHEGSRLAVKEIPVDDMSWCHGKRFLSTTCTDTMRVLICL